jgi:hypothetical protein
MIANNMTGRRYKAHQLRVGGSLYASTEKYRFYPALTDYFKNPFCRTGKWPVIKRKTKDPFPGIKPEKGPSVKPS